MRLYAAGLRKVEYTHLYNNHYLNMINVNIEITHDLNIWQEVYIIAWDMSVKNATLQWCWIFDEKDKGKDTVILIEIENEDWKKQVWWIDAKDIFLTAEDAEAELLKRSTEAEANQTEELKKLYLMILERKDTVSQQLKDMGIDVDSLQPETKTESPTE